MKIRKLSYRNKRNNLTKSTIILTSQKNVKEELCRCIYLEVVMKLKNYFVLQQKLSQQMTLEEKYGHFKFEQLNFYK